ncbi:unnamed protein product [Closterium sp. Yama58-4]|nr:unnamed protein product [Closterium sp. Yama58-4]
MRAPQHWRDRYPHSEGRHSAEQNAAEVEAVRNEVAFTKELEGRNIFRSSRLPRSHRHLRRTGSTDWQFWARQAIGIV